MSLKGMVGYDSRKVAPNRTPVKQDFRLPLVSFFRHRMVRNHNILGVTPFYQNLRLRANSLTAKRLSICARYVLYLVTFWAARFSTNIAAIAAFWPNAYTPTYRHQKRQSRVTLSFSFSQLLAIPSLQPRLAQSVITFIYQSDSNLPLYRIFRQLRIHGRRLP